ncbi:MAG TPA: DUF4271 domain-containing protein [Mucilaginibacter sp.]|nr:DUF4271 domain-containing protein [Mucilaginibacter sp.]
MRFLICLFLLSAFCCRIARAQQEEIPAKRDSSSSVVSPVVPKPIVQPILDSATLAAVAKERREQFVADSMAMKWLVPDSLRENKFLTALMTNPFANLDSLLKIPRRPPKNLFTGNLRTFRDPWLLEAIFGLLLYTGLLNIFLGRDIRIVLQSFYSKQALVQLDKDGGIINWWAFVTLFILFSLSAGLFLYQLTVYYEVDNVAGTGFRLFMILSGIVSLLFALKFLALKFIGFVFDAGKIVSEYIGILNLTYFNLGFVLLSAAVCFSLLSQKYIPGLLTVTLILMAAIFAWQYLRNSVSIISNIRFPKFYLFIYLCALEFCPILILIKALNI